jgi:flagellar protein FliO/FliZ
MEFEGYIRFFLALIFVLALIGVLTAVARRFGFGYRKAVKGSKGRRLSIVEVMPVDAKRRLVLLRRDSTDHLVLLGSGPDLLLEGGIPAPTDAPAADEGSER